MTCNAVSKGSGRVCIDGYRQHHLQVLRRPRPEPPPTQNGSTGGSGIRTSRNTSSLATRWYALDVGHYKCTTAWGNNAVWGQCQCLQCGDWAAVRQVAAQAQISRATRFRAVSILCFYISAKIFIHFSPVVHPSSWSPRNALRRISVACKSLEMPTALVQVAVPGTTTTTTTVWQQQWTVAWQPTIYPRQAQERLIILIRPIKWQPWNWNRSYAMPIAL